MAIQISCLRDGDFTKKCGSFRSFRWEWRNSISQLRSESIYNYFSDVKSAINENINGWMFIDILMYKRLPDYLIFKFPIMVSILTHNDDTKNIFPSSEQLPKCYPFQDLWQLFYFFTWTRPLWMVHNHPGGPETVLTKRTFLKKMPFSLQRNAHFDEQNLAKFSRENLAKFAFREGFWQNVSDTFSSSFRPGVSASRSSFAGGDYVHWHIAIASTWHTGEDLCFLNTTIPEISFWTQRSPTPPHPTPSAA